MKFQSLSDKKLFLIEIGRMDLIESIDNNWEPSSDLIEMYISKRKELIPKLRDFRRSQSAKMGWRHHRYNMLKGIRRYHRSTHGKRMHRIIGDFLAKRDIFESDRLNSDLYEVLKALNSLKTHSFIELGYYIPIDEYIEYTEFIEELIPAVNRIEANLLCGSINFEPSDIEILFRAVDEGELLSALSNRVSKPLDEFRSIWESNKAQLINKDKKESYEFFYTELVSSVINTSQ